MLFPDDSNPWNSTLRRMSMGALPPFKEVKSFFTREIIPKKISWHSYLQASPLFPEVLLRQQVLGIPRKEDNRHMNLQDCLLLSKEFDIFPEKSKRDDG